MTTISVQDAESKLGQIIAGLKPGDEVVLTDHDHPVARLVAVHPGERKQRQPGSARGILEIVADDDEHLEDFKEYMP